MALETPSEYGNSDTPTDRADRALALDAEATEAPWEQAAWLIWSPSAQANVAGASELKATGWVEYTAPTLGSSHQVWQNAQLIAEYRSLAPALARDVRALTAKVERLRTAARAAIEVAQWMSGSPSFSPSGEANEGWENVMRPQLFAAMDALREAEEVRE